MKQIVELLKTHDRFVIAGHIGPDEDTIGSCFGLAMALGKLGKKAVVMLEPGALRPKHKIIPGWEYLYRDTEPLAMDVFIALDCADAERLGPARAFLKKAKLTICIDHHETNNGFADYNLIDPNASSTAEMVFGVIEALTDIDINIATAIYAGIVADTGGFKYMSTSRPTMEIAARLMDTGIPFTEIYSEVMDSHSFVGIKAFGLALDASKLAMDGRIIYSCMTREMIANSGAESSDMDGVVEYLMNTRGTEVALFLYERHQNGTAANSAKSCDEAPCEYEGHDIICSAGGDAADANEPIAQRKIKVSMRSRKLHIGKIAAALGGGGHRLAAGCTMVGTMDDVLQNVLGMLERELEH